MLTAGVEHSRALLVLLVLFSAGECASVCHLSMFLSEECDSGSLVQALHDRSASQFDLPREHSDLTACRDSPFGQDAASLYTDEELWPRSFDRDEAWTLHSLARDEQRLRRRLTLAIANTHACTCHHVSYWSACVYTFRCV